MKTWIKQHPGSFVGAIGYLALAALMLGFGNGLS